MGKVDSVDGVHGSETGSAMAVGAGLRRANQARFTDGEEARRAHWKVIPFSLACRKGDGWWGSGHVAFPAKCRFCGRLASLSGRPVSPFARSVNFSLKRRFRSAQPVDRRRPCTYIAPIDRQLRAGCALRGGALQDGSSGHIRETIIRNCSPVFREEGRTCCGSFARLMAPPAPISFPPFRSANRTGQTARGNLLYGDPG